MTNEENTANKKDIENAENTAKKNKTAKEKINSIIERAKAE
jgi:hypothetical protein